MIQTIYNPDVLSCLANLSNDEVFTPPGLANDILDLLPASLWRNPKATFLDPVCKSGVFLREIAKRLDKGLETQIPDKQKRINHIFTQQLFGIAITELTSLMSRRTVYGSKFANGKYSFCETFESEQGNIRFKKMQHSWADGKCSYCGASQEVYEREEALESYAYNFIHTDKPEKLFGNMKFDVIVGNPPYQLSDGGAGASAKPIYHKFVEQAIKLNPKFITMIIPARWFAGGRVGELSEFREKMLKDKRIRILHDFQDASDCFPGVEIKGGVNYFLWDRDNEGLCKVFSHRGDIITSETERFLLEEGATTFIRFNEAIPILKKVQLKKERSFSEIVSANDPFGFDIREVASMKRIKPQYRTISFEGAINFYYNGWRKSGLGFIDEKHIKKLFKLINNTRITRPRGDIVPSDEPFERSGTVFRNNQIRDVVKKLRRKNILQISLCEVYNDARRHPAGSEYTPFTMEVKVLYRNISRELVNRVTEANATRQQEILLATQRRMREIDEARRRQILREANRERVRAPRAISDIEVINQLHNNINAAVMAQDRAEARRLREQLLNFYITLTTRFSPTDPAQEMLQQGISQLREILNEVNPNQLQVVPTPNPVPAIGSASYPDMCVICQEPVVGEGCRVNCPAGHIYHCDCINGYRNSRAGNEYYDSDFHNDCPYCRQPISQMYRVNIPEGFTTGFGRRRSNFGKKRKSNKGNTTYSSMSLKSIDRLIKLVQKM